MTCLTVCGPRLCYALIQVHETMRWCYGNTVKLSRCVMSEGVWSCSSPIGVWCLMAMIFLFFSSHLQFSISHLSGLHGSNLVATGQNRKDGFVFEGQVEMEK